MHGDDYVSAGESQDLDWLESELSKQYEIKTQRTRPREDGGHVEAKILNRIVRRTQHGYELEADPRHAELLIQELTKEESRAISAPGSAEVSEEKEGEQLKGEQNPGIIKS